MKRVLSAFAVFMAIILSACGSGGQTATPQWSIPPLTLPAEHTPPPTPPVSSAPVPTPHVTVDPGPLPDADDLTGETLISYNSGTNAVNLTDYNYETKYALAGSSLIDITCPKNIYSLYVIWDLPPGSWNIKGTREESFGDSGFIHEYVRLAEPSKELELTLPADGATICDIYAFSYGAPPDWVQQWLPPWEEADMLLIPTHADDEHLFFGGAMPYYAGEMGLKVQVAYLTNHWNSPPRPHELLNGLWTVGIRAYPIISEFNDLYAGSLAEAERVYSTDSIMEFQVWLLRRFRPLVVVNHDINGEYGHGVHMLNAKVIQEAVLLAADSTSYPESAQEYGSWDTPKLYLHLYAQNEIIMNWDVPLDFFDGATAYEMAVAGYDCHKSQHQWAFAVRQAGDPYDCRRFGLIRSTVGEDVNRDDMFENITMRG